MFPGNNYKGLLSKFFTDDDHKVLLNPITGLSSRAFLAPNKEDGVLCRKALPEPLRHGTHVPESCVRDKGVRRDVFISWPPRLE